jgi:5-methylcytosine-specific restriction protein A
MAVTQGHGNPAWTRDEVLLALNLYFECEGQVPGPSDPRVIALSQTLRALPLHLHSAKNERFRNPDGVAFKLQNIRQVATGAGLGNVSSMDRQVWAEFGPQPQRVTELVKALTASDLFDEISEADVLALDDDAVFAEGRLLTALHCKRERHPRLRREFLKRRAHSLHCDACGDGPKVGSEALRDAGFEAHHRVPLASGGVRSTRLADLALLCATCHRLIHRAISRERRWVQIQELQALLGKA